MTTNLLQPMIQGIKKGEMRSLARAISILEDSAPLKARLLTKLGSIRGPKARGFSIGITGSAGSGKSTLIAALAKMMRRDKKKVAVISRLPNQRPARMSAGEFCQKIKRKN